MKKLLILPILFLLTVNTASAASVSRNMPSQVDPGSEVTVTLTLNGAPIGEDVVIEDSFPNTIDLISWEISGSQEAKVDIGYQKKESTKQGFDRHSWPFTTVSSSPSITYKINAPTTEGTYEFEARWITGEGFSRASAVLTVQAITCEDGVCEQGENSATCEVDCPKTVPPKEDPDPTEDPEPPIEKPKPTEELKPPIEEPEAIEEPKTAKKSNRAFIALVVIGNLVILGTGLAVLMKKRKQRNNNTN